MSGRGTRLVPVLVALVGLGVCAAPAAAKPHPSAKLRVVGLSASPSTVKAGDRIKVRAVVRNGGERSARPRMVTSLVVGGSSRPIAKSTYGQVDIRKRRVFNDGGIIPPNLVAGSYPLKACVRSKGPRKGKLVCRSTKIAVTATGPDGPVTPGKDYPAGARTAGDKLFPELGNGGYDVDHYAIALNYDAASNTFLAGTKTTITAKATQDLGEFSLDFEGLDVGSVTVNGAAATFKRVAPAACSPSGADTVCAPTKLVITPAAGIDKDSTFTTVVAYSGTPKQHTDPDGSADGWIRSCYAPAPLDPVVCDGSFVANEPAGAMTWFPDDNYMTDKATFDTSITTGASKVAIGAGQLQTSNPPPLDPGGATRTWVWSMSEPISTYLTSGSVTSANSDGLIQGTISTGGGARTIPTNTVLDLAYTGPLATNITTVLADTQNIVSYYSARYGNYPFSSAGAFVDQDPSIGYTLENATKIHFATNLAVDDETLAHEYAHQWFGDNATAATWQDLWFNEGYATWSQWNYTYDSDNSKPSPAQLFQDGYNDANMDWSVPPATLNDDSHELFNPMATYQRGAMTLEGYSEIVGSDAGTPRALTLAQHLQDAYAYSNITTAQFIAAAEAESGFTGPRLQLLDDYFQQWLYSDVKPTITPSSF